MGFIFDIEMLVINIYYKASISNSRKNENFLGSFMVLFYTSFSPLVYCFVLLSNLPVNITVEMGKRCPGMLFPFLSHQH